MNHKRKHVIINLIIMLLVIACILTGAMFLTMKSPGTTVLGFSFLGGAALLYLAVEAVKHLRNIEHLLAVAVNEPVTEDQREKPFLEEAIDIELKTKDEHKTPTDTNNNITPDTISTKPRRLRGQ